MVDAHRIEYPNLLKLGYGVGGDGGDGLLVAKWRDYYFHNDHEVAFWNRSMSEVVSTNCS